MNEQIQQWQSSLPSADRDDLACTRGDGLAARLTLAACEVYQLTLKHLAGQIPKQSYRRFERSRDYLVLWSDGYGALSGDLDIVLSDSRRLRHATLGHLVSICRTLANSPLAHNQTETRINELAAEVRELAEAAAYTIRDQAKSDSDSDGDDSDVSSDNGDSRLEDVAGDLETEIGCLQTLGPSYEEPVQGKPIKEKPAVASHDITWDPAEYLAARIRDRYPNGDDKLLSLLGKANWHRILRLHAVKEENSLVAEADGPSQGKAATIGAASFHDSGLGSSVSPASSYAATLVSYRGGEGGSVRIPSLPTEGAGGKPFTCFMCARKICTPTTSSWKQHVLLDLQPYVCFLPACRFNSSPFEHKKTWIQHLELDHDFANNWQDMTCLLCRAPAGSSKQAVVSHLSRHLEETSLTILHTNGDSDDEESGHSSDLESVINSTSTVEENEERSVKLDSAKEPKLIVEYTSSKSGLKKTAPKPPAPMPRDTEVIIDPESQIHVSPDVKSVNRKQITLTELAIEPEEADRVSVQFPSQRAASRELVTEKLMLSPAWSPERPFAKESEPMKCSHPGCDKDFRRPSDWSKHEMAHTRVWKCPKATCKYGAYGWSTEKELDRHIRDKHSSNPPKMYECSFKPCPYRSKRESNCKQHMEKAHGWTWLRTKVKARKHGTSKEVQAGHGEGENDFSITQAPVPTKWNAVDSGNEVPSFDLNNRFPFLHDDQLGYTPHGNEMRSIMDDPFPFLDLSAGLQSYQIPTSLQNEKGKAAVDPVGQGHGMLAPSSLSDIDEAFGDLEGDLFFGNLPSKDGQGFLFDNFPSKGSDLLFGDFPSNEGDGFPLSPSASSSREAYKGNSLAQDISQNASARKVEDTEDNGPSLH